MRSILLFGLGFIGSASGYASGIGICGVVDNSAGDSNQAVGVIKTNCFFTGGSFAGTVTETTANATDYIVDISGIFRGTGTLSLTGQFSLSAGPGTRYNYISDGGMLRSDTVGASTSTDFFSFADASVFPVLVANSLPMGLSSGIGLDITRLTFSPSQTFSLPIHFDSGGADHFFDFSGTGRITLSAFTDASSSIRPIPEPTTLEFMGIAVVILGGRRRSTNAERRRSSFDVKCAQRSGGLIG